MKDKILAYIHTMMEENEFEKCNTLEISKAIQQSRNHIATIINELYEQNVLLKVKTRPSIFLDRHYLEDKYDIDITFSEIENVEKLKTLLTNKNLPKDFEQYIGVNDSLSTLIDKIKATVSYPPVGLPILLNGPTGTGKSFLARLTYEYCINNGLIDEDKKFIQVNCSEYTNNPELLTANLFGYKKGAFTGADKDNLGLVHHANGGVLFLDEVHCLKAECQEKLFLFMDQGIYHLVGDNEKWYESKCRIIFATTENPQEVLLKTLLRRIPVILEIPSLQQRGINEKILLIYSLYHQEEKRIHKKINISSNVYQLLLNYNFTGNIGELSNIIQASCVNALFNQKDDTIEIHAYHLPEQMIASAHPTSLMLQKHHMLSLESIVPHSNQSKIIEFYHSLLSLNKNENFAFHANKIIDEYFEKIIFNKRYTVQKSYVLDTVGLVLDTITSRYGFKISHNEQLALATYLLEYSHNTYEIAKWISQKHIDIKSLDDYLKNKYYKEYLIAKEAFLYFKDNFNEALDQMVQCVLVLMISKHIHHDAVQQTVAIILSHGYSTASSMAESVNRLLNTYIFDAIDMPLNVSSQMIVDKVNDYLSCMHRITRLYLLVDMGSLEDIYQGIAVKNVDIVIVNNVNTKLALDIGERIKNNQSTMNIFENIQERHPYNVHMELHCQKEPIILCSCASGLGVAQKLKTIVTDSLPKQIDIKVMTYDYTSLIECDDQNNIFNEYEVICIIGTLNPHIKDINYIGIEDLIINDGYEKLEQYFSKYFNQEQIDLFKRNLLKNFTLSNVMNHLTILNPDKLLEHVSTAIDELQKLLHKKLKNKTCFGLYVHICCLIERLVTRQEITSYNSDDFLNKHQDFIIALKYAMKEVETFYNVNIPNEEIEYIYQYVKND